MSERGDLGAVIAELRTSGLGREKGSLYAGILTRAG